MREIIFRAKAIEGGGWVYGDYEYNPAKDITRIHSYNEDGTYKGQIVVDKDTVGQFVGLCDMHGNKIFEGDVVQCGDFVYSVVYSYSFASFGLRRKQDMYMHYFGEAMRADECEVIGNIYDKKEGE